MYIPEFQIAQLLHIKEPIDQLDFDIKLRYFLNKKDPTINSIIKEYPKLVKKIKSRKLEMDDDRVVKTNKDIEIVKLFDLNSLSANGYDPNYVPYDVLLDYVLSRYCRFV